MAIISRRNITSNEEYQLLNAGDDVNIRYISLANVHASDATYIDIYMSNYTNTYYFMKGRLLQKGETLRLTSNEIPPFDNSSSGYGLFIKLTGAHNTTGSIDLLLNTTARG